MAPMRGMLLAVLLAASSLAGRPAHCASETYTPGQGAAVRALDLTSGSGRLLTLGGPAANVFVADPKVAEVRPASASTLFVFGVAPGRTTIAALDGSGRPLAQYQVSVRPSDFAALEAQDAITRIVPGQRVVVRAQARGLALSGEVQTPEQQARVQAVARSFLAAGQTLLDDTSVTETVQVSLRVRIAEMSRQVTRALGIEWQALGTIGRFGTLPAANLVLNDASLNGSGLVACGAGALLGTACGGASFDGILDALAQDNLARILAEPTLTVTSGQPATFLAGGEFPIPVAQQNNNITIEFKKYGVRLDFVPTVLSSGNINLHVSPEVSQLTSNGAVQLAAGNSTIQVPALTVRRAETTVELGSGQSFAIAGLLQESVSHTTNGIPVLGDLPYVGGLFRGDHLSRQEDELVILVTPYIVRPVSDPAALHLPGEDTTTPSDVERLLLLRQVSPRTAALAVHVPGQAGFIVQ